MKKRFILLFLAFTFILFSKLHILEVKANEIITGDSNSLVRISGKNRYETAMAISNHIYKDGTDNVIIASGVQLSDALVGGVLAAKLDAPILLSSGKVLSSNLSEELERLSPSSIYIIGGEHSISSELEDSLKEYSNVFRLAGANRYETSVEVANLLISMGERKGLAFASGNNFSDALVGMPLLAKRSGYPLILTDGIHILSGLTASDNNIIFGGYDSVNIEGFKGVRYFGGDSYETALDIAKKGFSKADKAIIVNANCISDALSSISLSVKYDCPIILINSLDLDKNIISYIENNINSAIVVGGENSINSTLVNNLKELIKKNSDEDIKDNNIKDTKDETLITKEPNSDSKNKPLKEDKEDIKSGSEKNCDNRDKEKIKREEDNFQNIIHDVKKVNKEMHLEDLNNFNYEIEMFIKQILMDIEKDIPYEIVGNPKISIMENKSSEKYNINDITDFVVELFSKEVLADDLIEKRLISTYIVNIELKAEEKALDQVLKAVHTYNYEVNIDVYENNENQTLDSFVIEDNVIVGLSQKGLNEVKATESLTIPIIDGVDTIGKSAFELSRLDGANIKNIVIISPIKIIEEAAFKGNNIVSLKLNDELQSIGDYSFQGNCLEFLELSKNVRTIGKEAFIPDKDHGIKNLELNEKINFIGKKAFYRNNISELKLPSSLKEISVAAFGNNNSLKEISLNEGIEIIGKEAFSNTDLAGEIVIPKSVIHLMERSFENTLVDSLFIKGDEFSNTLQIHSNISPILESIRFENPSKKSYISRRLSNKEDGVKVDLGEVEVKDNISCIEEVIKELNIQQSAYYINLSDESGKSDKLISSSLIWDIDNLDLSQPMVLVKGISEDFRGFEEIKGYKLEDFSNYEKQNDFIINLKLPPKEEWSVKDFIYSGQKIIRLSDSGKEKIQANKNLVLPTTNKEGEFILEIGKSAFMFKNIESLTLPKKLEKIGENAFSHNKISEVILPDTLILIEDYAFSENDIFNLELSEGLESIGANAFEDNNLSQVRLPSSLSEIKDDSFSNNQGIVSLYSINPNHKAFNTEFSSDNHLVIIEY